MNMQFRKSPRHRKGGRVDRLRAGPQTQAIQSPFPGPYWRGRGRLGKGANAGEENVEGEVMRL